MTDFSDRAFEACIAELGVTADVSKEALERAYLQKSYTLIREGGSAEARNRLRSARATVLAHIEKTEVLSRQSEPRQGDAPLVAHSEVSTAAPDGAKRKAEEAETVCGEGRWRWSDAIAVPAVTLLAVVLQRSFAGFLFEGFHVWIHEFGHATVAWLTGHRALPLPIGWTNIDPEKSLFVYFGVVFLLGVMAVAGWRERKPIPVVASVLLLALQAYATWLLPADRAQLWITFAGVGGEFYLAAAMMGLFWFELPEKFKWRICRYVFLFIGATSFSRTYTLWYGIRHGTEAIPYGSLINGEEDDGGDLNVLHDDFHWSQHQIVSTYYHLGNICLAVTLMFYMFFAFRVGVMITERRHCAVK